MQVSSSEICAGEFIPDALPLTEENLVGLIERFPERFDLRLALGNILFHQGRFSEALQPYQQALNLEPNSAEGLCNLGVTYGKLGRPIRAIACLRRALLIKPELILLQLTLANLARQRGDEELEQAAYGRVLELQPTNEEGLLFFARRAEQTAELQQAQNFYQRLRSANPQHRIARNRLAYFEFQAGLALYDSGNLEAALELWAEVYARYGPAFSDESEIVRNLKRVVKEFSKTSILEDLLASYNASTYANFDHYDLVIKFLFSIGALPELYESRNRLKESEAYWQASLSRDGDYPYLRFRISLLEALSGEVDQALEGLRKAGDLLKGKKLEPLFLPQLIQFLAALQQRRRVAADSEPQPLGEEEWQVEGFVNQLEIRLWKRTGLTALQARLWKESGFSAVDAKQWVASQLPPDEAAAWKAAGLKDPKSVRLWSRGEIPHSVAFNWQENFTLSVGLAIQCIRAGFEDPGEAQQWMQVFQFPSEAFSWKSQGFDLTTAKHWRDQGISDPFEALSRDPLT